MSKSSATAPTPLGIVPLVQLRATFQFPLPLTAHTSVDADGNALATACWAAEVCMKPFHTRFEREFSAAISMGPRSIPRSSELDQFVSGLNASTRPYFWYSAG